MITIVGLGNPGNEYEETRHNVGFVVIDALCKTLRTNPEAGKGDYLIATGINRGYEIALVKPLTYMNNSGLAIMDLLERYELRLKDLLIICDDFNLPLGRLRLRPAGSDGGHNGLSSIIYQLQTDEFPRLRCGIGNPEAMLKASNATEFVLSIFEPEEEPLLREMIRNAHDAALCFASDGLPTAMNRWNSPGTCPNN